MRRLWRERGGATAIEFALAFAFFVLPLTIGLLEVGFLIFDFHVLNEQTRRVARDFDVHRPAGLTCANLVALPIVCPGGAGCDATQMNNAVASIAAALPPFTAANFTAANLRVTYSDSQLDDFAVTPICTPTVTVSIINLQRGFLVVDTLFPGLGATFSFPSFSSTRVMGTVTR